MADRTTVFAALGAGHEGPVWLLELDVGGRLYRVADLQVEIDDELWQAGLSPVVLPEAGDLLESLSVDVDIGEDWAQLIADNAIALEVARATLWRWWPGQDLRDAELVLSGDVTEPEWGSRDEPLSITINRSETSPGLMLEPQAVIDTTTWPDNYRGGLIDGGFTDWTRHESAEGQACPLIIGYPGRTVIPSLGGIWGQPTTPALIASSRWSGTPPAASASTVCVIAGHRVQAAQVRVSVYTGDYQQNELRDVLYIDDALGQTRAYVDFNSSTLPQFGQNPNIWIGWSDASGQGGGLQLPDGTVMRKAYDVIEWVLRTRTTRRVDWGRMAAARDVLDLYLVDTFINAQVEAWRWLEDELFRLLPIVVLESEQGLYLKVVRWRAEAREAAAHLDADGHIVERSSRLMALNQPVENQIEVVFQRRREQWDGRRWVAAQGGRLTGSETGEDDTRILEHDRCRASEARYGLRARPEPVEASWTWDPGTAERIARDLADRYALPLRTVRYTCGWDLDPIEPWDVVTVTDSEVSLDEAVALVSQITRGEDGIELDVILLPAA